MSRTPLTSPHSSRRWGPASLDTKAQLLTLARHNCHLLTHVLTHSLTYLPHMQGFYEFSFPFSEGLCGNLRHFCCPAALKLWRRPAPESDWPDTFWRNKYYSCFG